MVHFANGSNFGDLLHCSEVLQRINKVRLTIVSLLTRKGYKESSLTSPCCAVQSILTAMFRNKLFKLHNFNFPALNLISLFHFIAENYSALKASRVLQLSLTFPKRFSG